MIPSEYLNQMIPRAAVWVAAQERLILDHKNGIVLSAELQEVARKAGIARPETVRLLGVVEMPLPEDPELRQAALHFGVPSPATDGLTMGHGVFIKNKFLSDRHLIAHELRHVAQYEQHGSILGFLQKYFAELNQYAYAAAPMEVEAEAFAESVFPSRG